MNVVVAGLTKRVVDDTDIPADVAAAAAADISAVGIAFAAAGMAIAAAAAGGTALMSQTKWDHIHPKREPVLPWLLQHHLLMIVLREA